MPRGQCRRADGGRSPSSRPKEVDLVIVDRDSSGLDAPAVCRLLRDDPRLGDAWLLAITVAAKGRMADSVLNAGADDYLHRPFTRAELIARTRAGLRAAEQRANDRLLRTLMENVPGRDLPLGLARRLSCWRRSGDEIERISGHPPAGFLASTKRTILFDRPPRRHRRRARGRLREATENREAFVLEYRIVRADGEVRWVLDRGQPVPGPGGRLLAGRRAVRYHRAARGRGGAAARTRSRRRASAELRAARASASSRPPTAARRKIERDLHDGAQQRLVSLVLDVQVAKRRLAKEPFGAAEFLERLGTELQEASAELRELARGIHPAVLTERGLVAAIGALAARSPVPVEVVDPPQERFPPAIEATAYFTVAEALTNVAKYAEATPRRRARRRCDGAELVVEVRDDGIGGATIGSGIGPERARRPRGRAATGR